MKLVQISTRDGTIHMSFPVFYLYTNRSDRYANVLTDDLIFSIACSTQVMKYVVLSLERLCGSNIDIKTGRYWVRILGPDPPAVS